MLTPMLLYTLMALSQDVPAATGPRGCAVAYAIAASNAPSLDYRAFDQDPEAGWRGIRTACPRQAVRLIDSYLILRRSSLKETESANLNFHALQIELSLRRNRAALKRIPRAFVPFDTSVGPLDWNAYVGATRAFLTRDRQSFDRYRATLSMRKRHGTCSDASCERQDQNLPAVERLARCWGSPYEVAYYRCEGG